MVFIDNGKFKCELKGIISKVREIYCDLKKKWIEIFYKWEVKMYFKEIELNGNIERWFFFFFFIYVVFLKV